MHVTCQILIGLFVRHSFYGKFTDFLTPANEAYEGYVFTGVSLSTGRGCQHLAGICIQGDWADPPLPTGYYGIWSTSGAVRILLECILVQYLVCIILYVYIYCKYLLFAEGDVLFPPPPSNVVK